MAPVSEACPAERLRASSAPSTVRLIPEKSHCQRIVFVVLSDRFSVKNHSGYAVSASGTAEAGPFSRAA